MQLFPRKTIVVGIFLLLLAICTIFILSKREHVVEEVLPPQVPEVVDQTPKAEVVGNSVLGREIEMYTFGQGQERLLFVGGVHGGYEWNSVLLAYQFIDYISANPDFVPANLSISIIPALNPDGVFDVLKKEGRFALADVPADEGAVGNGRFNANGVDLNRNFACKWKSTSTWRGNTVSAGTSAFSEPEALALKNVVDKIKPKTVVFWHSQANAVYASECENGILDGTRSAMNAYANAGGYPAVDVFDAYEITGDAEGWLASIGIPAITVELATHKTIEWEKNLAGVKALVALFVPKI